jgi:cytochrome c biogenesis protein CcdA
LKIFFAGNVARYFCRRLARHLGAWYPPLARQKLGLRWRNRVMEMQSWIVALMERLAALLPFGYAFGAGMLATVNPCGFFMLPVYLSLYLGAEEREIVLASPWRRLFRAFWVALVVTCGFTVVFLACGLLMALGGLALMSLAPWFALIIAALFIVTGVWMLFGQSLSFLHLHKIADKIGDPRDITTRGFFLFGLAYGLTSLGCALPIFLAMLGGAISTGDAAFVVRQCLAYVAGTGFILIILTLAIAFVKQRMLVGALRKILPYSQKLAAFLLLAAGAYIIYYWLSSQALTVAS